MPEENFKYQSNDNYPWEYDDQVEIWVADFSLRKNEAKQAAIDDGLLTEEATEEILVTEIDPLPSAMPVEEEISEKIEELFEHSIQDHDQTVAALKAKSEFSWVLATGIITVVLVAGEIALSDISLRFFWDINWLTAALWIWRLIILLVWLILAQKKWQLNSRKVYASAVSAFVLGVIISAIWKIVIIGAVWTWLNLLIEPVWIILLVALVGSLFTRFILPDKYGRYKS